MGFLWFLYFVMAILVTSFSFAHLAHGGQIKWKTIGVDGMDYFIYALVSLFLGSFWFITIWLALIIWYISDGTPFWAEILIDIKDKIRK